jgi:alanine-glyoxylate transaminase/serine-glyoxylate transaminase/serine-pyruvate transaminase
MSLAQGRHYLAIPGPSVVPDRVLNAMHRASPNIYTGELHDVTRSLFPDLKSLAGTQGEAAIYVANGHGAWEAALSNVLSRGDGVLVLATGRFAVGWGETAARLGAEVQTLDFGLRSAVDPVEVTKALLEDEAHAIRAVLVVQVDTASSVRNDIAAIRTAIDEANHPALLMVDCIASFGVERFEMDALGVDVMVSGSQKGLMLPPGLGFVFYNDRADRARERADCVTGYWDWRPRSNPDIFYQYFCGTAPTHHIYGLREALDMIQEEGRAALWLRHEILARAIWAACEVWAEGGKLELNIPDRAERSHAVTALRLPAPHGTDLREWMTANAGVTLGIGIGMAAPDDPAWHGFFRIGHMGHVNAHMVLGTLAALDAGLKALDLRHGRGALDAAAEVVARLDRD